MPQPHHQGHDKPERSAEGEELQVSFSASAFANPSAIVAEDKPAHEGFYSATRRYKARRSPSFLKLPKLAAATRSPLSLRSRPFLTGTGFEECSDMCRLIAIVVAGLMASPAIVFAGPHDLATYEPRPFLSPARAFRQLPADQSSPQPKPWMARHPVWFGLIVGASGGAAWGALSCRNGCFPIGAGGAAMVGSWWGAGAGALIGWGVGRAK